MNALFPPRDQRLIWSHRLTALLDAAERRVAAVPIAPSFDPAAYATELASFDFKTPIPFDEALAWTVAQLEQGVTHVTHPRYLGLYNPQPSFPAQCADRIAASFNPQLASQTTSPAAVAIEAHVIKTLARRAGLPLAAAGHFTSGGSEANGAALLCALTRAEPGFTAHGARAFKGDPAFYVSRDSHLAWVKLAHMAGIGRDAVRFVPTDGTGRMNLAALEAALLADRSNGRVPVMIVATAGTTNAGMIDPLPECAAIARRAGLWYHVDAAWGGGALASDRLCGRLAGIAEADSITIDAHKWFAATMGAGMFLTAHPDVLASAFNVAAGFMPSQRASADPYMNSAQWSRRFIGLRLFLSLATGGWAAHGAHVERAVELAQRLANQARAHGWRVANDPALAVVCLEPPAGSASVRAIVRHLLETGGAWLSVAAFEGRDVVRGCITNGETAPADIDAVVALLEAARASSGRVADRVALSA